MPSPKIFSLKSRACPKIHPLGSTALLTLTLLAGFLTSCTTIEESRSVFDIPLADEYMPVVNRDKDFHPKRVLVLPVTGVLDSNYRQVFENQVFNWLKQPDFWTVVPFSATASSADTAFAVSRFEAYRRARSVGADAILFVNVTAQEVYNPIRLSASAVMERVDSQLPAMNVTFDYDTRNREVVDSARRYYQKYMGRTFGGSDAPDKSQYILSNNEPFVEYAGAHTGLVITKAFEPIKTKEAGSMTK